MISTALSLFSFMPFVSYSALAFYLFLAGLVLSKEARLRFKEIFLPPLPSTHSPLAPFDAFRGFAAVWVFFYHLWLFMLPVNYGLPGVSIIKHGGMAVPVFATLSGLLVFRSIRNIDLTSKEVRMYLLRRLLRIYPLYVFTLVLGGVTLALTSNAVSIHGMREYAADLFMLRVVGYPDHFGIPTLNPPAWSIYIEVFFYIVLPVFVAACGRRILAVSIAAFLLFSLISNHAGANTAVLLQKYFLTGVILCELISRKSFDRLRGVFPLIIFAAGIILFALCCKHHPVIDDALNLIHREAVSDKPPYAYANYSITVAVAAALVFIGALKSKAVNWALSLYPFRYIGIISYSVYLMHSIILRVAVWRLPSGLPDNICSIWSFFFLFLPVILLYSSITYAVIERPFLKLRPLK